MDIGTKFQIEFKREKIRLLSKVVGIEEKKYIIIKAPYMAANSGVNLLANSSEIAVRYIEKGAAFGFTSHIFKFISDPDRLLFVEYPNKIESHNLSDRQRLNCYLPAQITLNENSEHKVIIEGAIIDVSKGGCKFAASKQSLEEYDFQLQVDFEVLISFNLPGLEQLLRITSLAKNTHFNKSGNNLNIGLRFTKIDKEMNTILNNFLSSVVT